MDGLWQAARRGFGSFLPDSVPEPTMACLTAGGEFADPDLQSQVPLSA